MNDWLKTDAGWFGVDHFPSYDDVNESEEVEPTARGDVAPSDEADQDQPSAAAS